MADYSDARSFIYRIDAQNRITYLSPEWLDFARENQAWQLTAEKLLGRDLDRFVSGWEVQHLYDLIYQKVRRLGREFCFPFRCDSPDIYRFMEMRITPQDGGAIEFTARIIRQQPHPPLPLLDPFAVRSSAIITICSWCKRLRADQDRWSEIQEILDENDLFGAVPPQLTHGVCPDCAADLQRRAAQPPDPAAQ